jgi:glycosyltransferase involved in cell wall biosynthesis
MRVAIVSPFITSYFDPSGLYYSSQQVHLARALAALGNRVTILAGRRPGCEATPQPVPVELRWLPLSRFGPGPMVLLRGLEGCLRKGGFDLVITMESYSPVSWQAARSHPRILLYHGYSGMRGGLPSRLGMAALLGTVEPFVLKRAIGAFAKSTMAAGYLASRGVDRVATTGVGVDTGLFHPLAEEERGRERERLGFPAGRMLLSVGNLIPFKDVSTILDAFERTAGDRPDLFLVIVGDGPDSDRVRQRIRAAGRGARIFWRPRILHRDLPRYFAAADRFVFASQREIFGMVLLEALSCGTPIATTPVGGAPLLAGEGTDAVSLFPVRDAAALSLLMVGDPSPGARGRARALAERHSWERVAAAVNAGLLEWGRGAG